MTLTEATVHNPPEAQNRREPALRTPLPTCSSSASASASRQPSAWTALLVITVLAAVLYLPAIDWGLPAYNSWSQDTIAGPNRTFVVKDWPHRWLGRYPPLHYLVNARLYDIIESYWRWRGWLSIDPVSGLKVLAEPRVVRLGSLILASHIVTWLMAVGTGLGLFFAARRLTGDAPAALFCALMFMSGADFAYFARLGNVDVPSMFWFAWALAAYARLLDTGRTRDGVLLGLLAAAAVATKDGVVGTLPGMAIVLIVHGLLTRRLETPIPAGPDETGSIRRCRVVLCPAFMWGLVAFIVPVLYINGAFHNWHGFAARLAYWLDESADTVQARQHRYDGQLALLGATVRYAGAAVGWPMLAAMIFGAAAALRYHRRVALITLIPLVSYYLLTIGWAMGFVYARFLFPMLALASIPAGWSMARWLRNPRAALIRRLFVILVIALPTLAYSSAVTLEMLTDSRYDAERWLDDHVPPGATIGVFSKPQYLPRLLERGYPLREIRMENTALAATDAEWLVVSSFETDSYNEKQITTLDRLLSGGFGFEVAASFTGRGFLDPRRCMLALPAIGTEPPGKISPRVTILRRISRLDTGVTEP